ncbi:hypothetical protein SEA_CICADA_9 [Microbacterium phage Cicada]|nr:hypothetical protein SEA_CICADA_9 [Microbacterium phage Cicada]
MRKYKNGEPQDVHRRCEATEGVEIPPYIHRCTANATPGTPYCERHQDEES